MEKHEKVILIIAGMSLVFLIIFFSLFEPAEGSFLETAGFISTVPIILGEIILRRNMNNPFTHPIIRIFGFIIFIIWIVSLFIRANLLS